MASEASQPLLFFLHGDLLMKILKKLDGNQVIFQKTNTKLLISNASKSDLFQISPLEIEGFEKFPTLEGGKTLGKISGETLKHLLDQNGLKIDGGNGGKCLLEIENNKITILTYDHARLTWAQGTCQVTNYNFSLDISSKQQLKKIITAEEIQLYLSKDEKYVIWKQNTRIFFTLRRPYTPFNYSKFIPKDNKLTIVERKTLKTALEKVQVAVSMINNAAKLTFNEKSKVVGIRGFNPALGTQGSTEVKAVSVTEHQEITLNIKYFLEALGCLGAEQIKIYIPGGKFIFLEGDSNFHVLMPIITS
jgi:DNA polymerase III sliding clamp (beta) subunit (PCNA family)